MPSAETTQQTNQSGSSTNQASTNTWQGQNQTTAGNSATQSNSVNSTSNVVNPYAPAQGNLSLILERAGQIANNSNNFIPVQGATTQGGIQALINAAQAGSAATNPLTSVVNGSVGGFGTGTNTLQSTAAGDRLSSESPALRAILDRVGQDTANRVNQQFSGSGRYGSSNHAAAIAREVSNAENQALLSNYNTERGLQDNAARTLYGGGFTGAGLAPQIDASRLLSPQLLTQAGALQDAQANAVRTAPQQSLQFLSSMTNPIAGLGQSSSGTSTNNSNQVSSQIQQLISAMQGGNTMQSSGTSTQSGTNSQSTSNPIGTGIGIASALLGLF